MAISPSPFDRIQKSRRASRSWLWWVLPAALLIGLALAFKGPAAELFWRLLEPVVRARESLQYSEAVALRAELAAAQARLIDRDALYKENLDLKGRLGRNDTQTPRVLAGVLQRSPWVPYDTLLIDAGAAQGVAVGDWVSAGGQSLIGRVAEVQASTARVELFSAPGQVHQAMLGGTSTQPVAVEGQGGGSLQASVPAGTEVSVGDPIIFPGLGGGITALVSAVDARPGESFIVIYMRLPADPFALLYVEVLKP
ncbi:MAG: Rod shape-determining protein MreC [Candidatus Adlerbacteria bacterium]|nr:Rod shape-determining protein MreC [Candidatus Adlerbacteria bacterium]